MEIRGGVDVGGTFTDFVYVKSTPSGSEIGFTKAHTTYPQFQQGVISSILKSNVPPSQIKSLAHGTTLIINALTQRKGPKTALITTQGFRDVLEIARGNRPDMFNLYYQKPPPFVPRYLRKELPERINHKGDVELPIDFQTLPSIIELFKNENIKAIAICFLNSYVNPIHEQVTIERIHELWPEVETVGSYEVTREWREYERTNTTVLTAFVKPITSTYLHSMRTTLAQINFEGNLLMMKSNCGVDSVENIKQIPITMVESGPSSGVWGAAALANILGEKNVIALDIGGTTAKCSLIQNGQVKINTDYYIEKSLQSAGYPIMVPVVDLVEIGNGGGSIAWTDEFNKLHVGPQSAGANPGPAGYGKGGNQITTTDANLILGRINKEYFCGGELSADMESVEKAMEALKSKLNLSTYEIAKGIIRMANHNMINAIKLISVNRGYDPRDFTLIAFGGGGGIHASEMASELGIKKVIIPKASSVFSAWGMLMCDIRRDYILTKVIEISKENLELLNSTIRELESKAKIEFENQSIKEIELKRFGFMRYQNQAHTVEVLLPQGTIDLEKMEKLSKDFKLQFLQTYTFSLNAPIEIVSVHTVAISKTKKISPAIIPRGDNSINPIKEMRKVDFLNEGTVSATIYDGNLIGGNTKICGPAVIEEGGATTLIGPNMTGFIDMYGNIEICLSSEETTNIISFGDDPITYEIIQSSLKAISDEMFFAMKRTAMSAIIYEVLDMGTAITDAKGELASSGAGIPGFVGTLDKSVKATLLKFGKNEIRKGDIFICNDPYTGGITHLNDIVLLLPIFADDNELISWSVNIAHWNDVGGMNPGSMATTAKEIFQEGLIIPPIKIFNQGTPNISLIEILKSNSRMPDFLTGDLWAGISAVKIGEKIVLELV